MRLTRRQLRRIINEAIRDISFATGEEEQIGSDQYMPGKIKTDEKTFREYFSAIDLPIDMHVFNEGELSHLLYARMGGTTEIHFHHVSKNWLMGLWDIIGHVSEKASDRPWYRVDKAILSQISILKRIIGIWKNRKMDSLTVALSAPSGQQSFDSSFGYLLHDMAGHNVDIANVAATPWGDLMQTAGFTREPFYIQNLLAPYLIGSSSSSGTGKDLSSKRGELYNDQFYNELRNELYEITPGVSMEIDTAATIIAYYLLHKKFPTSMTKYLPTEVNKKIMDVIKKSLEGLKGRFVIAIQ